MKIFIEAQKYPLSEVTDYLDNRYYDVDNQGNVQIPYVGYFYNAVQQCSVILLPKVFVGKENVLPKDFLFSTSTWLFLAIKQFQSRKAANQITEQSQVQEVISNLDKNTNSELEIVLSLLRFHRENQSLFTFIKKTNTSQQHKIDWTKTITKKLPFLNKSSQPVYFQTITKSKNINIEEELICIFLSILHDFKQKYHFRIDLNPMYAISKGADFERLKQSGTRRLKAIKSKYFSDKLVKLWHLCYAYFERLEQVRNGKAMNEILLVRDFNIVFEDMIDALLGDAQLPKSLKEHKDGKRLDHIYPYQSLIFDDDIYYIGDSKYYKNETEFSQSSKYKQFTYSKNVIQYNIDLFNKNELSENLRYRDELTEGYNVTPNFFISAFVGENFDFTKHELKSNGKVTEQNTHFKNRLFDRDTLHLQAYDINFLYVLHAYIAKNNNQKTQFSEQAKIQFRDNLRDYLNQNYDFYEVKPDNNIEDFINQNFRLLNGKMYRPSHFEDKILVALLKKNTDNQEIIKILSQTTTLYENTSI